MKSKKAILILGFVIVVLSLIVFLNSDKVLAPFAVYPFFNQSDGQINDFRIGVFAICEEKEDYIHCRDKIFASCNNNLMHVTEDFVECDGKIYEIREMDLEEKKFDKSWRDPRPENFLTLWAVRESP